MTKDKREISSLFGQKLKYYRQQRGYTCKDVARLACIDVAYISRLENGVRKSPSYPIIQKLAIALKVNVADLIEVDQDREEPLRSVQELLMFQDYLLSGMYVSQEIRGKLVGVIQVMLNSSWSEQSKHQDTINIIYEVNAFLNSLKA